MAEKRKSLTEAPQKLEKDIQKKLANAAELRENQIAALQERLREHVILISFFLEHYFLNHFFALY